VIVGIHNVDDAASVLVVETPQLPDLRDCDIDGNRIRSELCLARIPGSQSGRRDRCRYLVLTSDIPHVELEVLVLDRLDVETWWPSEIDGEIAPHDNPHATLKEKGGGVPIVGVVCTTSPNFILYKMVVLPAASKPTYQQARQSKACF
jgi:hypothetical protein